LQTLERFHVSIQAYLSSQDPFGTFFWNVQNTRKNTSQHIFTDILLFEKIISLGKKLPKKFIICMDNTCSENKNYIYFKWALLLLALGIFDEIQWIFLPVGHTHFVNDQVFSIFARELANILGGVRQLQDFYKVRC
jgi:hypothetical protein